MKLFIIYILWKMIDIEGLYKEFCEALPEDLAIDENRKREAFDFIYKICYIFTMEDWKDLYK